MRVSHGITQRIIGVLLIGAWPVSLPAHAASQAPALAETRTTLYHPDAIGSVRLTTAETGDVATAARYTPYGFALTSAASADETPSFAGKRALDATGTHDFGARHYAVTHARFLSPDPIRGATTTNLYTYALNNPLKYVDPDGQEAQPAMRRNYYITVTPADDVVSRKLDAVKALYWQSALMGDPRAGAMKFAPQIALELVSIDIGEWAAEELSRRDHAVLAGIAYSVGMIVSGGKSQGRSAAHETLEVIEREALNTIRYARLVEWLQVARRWSDEGRFYAKGDVKALQRWLRARGIDPHGHPGEMTRIGNPAYFERSTETLESLVAQVKVPRGSAMSVLQQQRFLRQLDVDSGNGDIAEMAVDVRRELRARGFSEEDINARVLAIIRGGL